MFWTVAITACCCCRPVSSSPNFSFEWLFCCPAGETYKFQNLGGVIVQEICSFLKGSSEAMDSPDGKLSLDSYLEVGRKRAPNFTADTRREVYPLFEKYEREKLRLNRCVSQLALCMPALANKTVICAVGHTMECYPWHAESVPDLCLTL